MEIIFRIFFRALVVKFENFGGNFLTVLLTLHSSCPEGKLKRETFLEKCSWVFFGSSAKKISDFWQNFSGGMLEMNSTCLEYLFELTKSFWWKNFLIDKLANCAECLRTLAGNSQHGCQNGILAAAMIILSYFFRTEYFSIDSRILKSKSSDSVEKT